MEIRSISMAVLVALLALCFSSDVARADDPVSKKAKHAKQAKQAKESKPLKKAKQAKKAKRGKVACINPNAACAESQKVIDTLKTISHAYSNGNFDEFRSYLAEGITIFDKRTKKLIVGKDAVVADVKKRWENAHSGPNPVVSYTIDHPYAKVTGDTAVVTFKATKVIGGEKPGKFVSKCTDVFVKEKDGVWRKLHYRSNWKKVKGS